MSKAFDSIKYEILITKLKNNGLSSYALTWFFRGSFVLSQSRFKVSASLTNVGSLAVGAFDLVNCSLSVVGFVPVFNGCQQMS